MTTNNIMTLNINERSYGYAKIYSALIQDEFQRKRAYVSILGLFALVDALEKTGNDIQKNMTLFRNSKLNEKYEISDIYVNDWHIDVRITGEGNNVLVPKSHFDNDIIPDFYAVIKLDKDLKKAELIGFADTIMLKKEPFDYHYYSVSFDSLISFEEFLLKVNKPKITNFDEAEHEKFHSSYLSIIDEEINVQDEIKIIQHLFECVECRREFCCFTGFEMVNSNLGKYPELLEDKTLNIIGAQAVEEEQYKDKEETITFEDKEELSENNLNENKNLKEENSDNTEDADILDSLFTDETGETDVNSNEDNPLELISNENNNELEIIEDDKNTLNPENSLPEVNDLMAQDNTPSLEILDDVAVELPSLGSDVTLIEDSSDNTKPISDNETSEIEIITDEHNDKEEETEVSDTNSDVQKVIVDYDEYGEPIYSYITNIPPQDEKTEDFEAELSDEDILNEEFETYNPVDNINDDLTNIKNGGQRTVEYVQNEEDIENPVTTTDLQEDSKEIQNDEQLKEEDILLEDYNQEDNSEPENQDLTGEDIPEEYNEELQSEETEIQNEENTISEETEQENYDDVEEFEDYNDTDESEENVNISQKKSNFVLLSVIAGIIIISSLVGGMLLFKNKSNSQTQTAAKNNENVQLEQPQNNDIIGIPQNNENQIPEAQDNMPNQETDNSLNNIGQNLPAQNADSENMMPSSGSIEVSPQLTENNLIQPQNPNTADANQAMTNAFSNGGSNLSLRNLNWMCTPQLFTDNEFKAYLQNLDNLLKLNIRKNILNATDNVQNPNISVKMAVDNDGNLIKSLIADSSGSEQIDAIVLQSINETFQGEKSPILTNSPLKSDKYYLKVIIKL